MRYPEPGYTYQKPRNTYDLYAAAAAMMATLPQPAETPKPEVSYEYVIRLDSGSRIAKLHGQYVEYNAAFGVPGFTRGRTLENATRFKTANDAADALKKRNVANPGGAELFSLVPVKVTVTPATTSTKTVDEVVPGKTEYEIHIVERNGTASIFSSVGPAGFWRFFGDRKRFATANEAAKVIEDRLALGTFFTNTPQITPVVTPATTKPKTVTETIPASTTVVLA